MQYLCTGQQFDVKAREFHTASAHGLYYLRARFYDPTLGRFLTRDPLQGSAFEPQSINPYAYAANNPVNRTDATGLLSEGGPITASMGGDTELLGACAAAISHALELLALLGIGLTVFAQGAVAILAASPPTGVFVAAIAAIAIVYFSWEIYHSCGEG